MQNFSCFRKYFYNVFLCSCRKIAFLRKSFLGFLAYPCQFLSPEENPFWIHLCYFIAISLIGFSVLKILEPKHTMNRPGNLDIFFMSVSATTVSSMGTVEMEVFSNSQLLVFIVLMLFGGEVFSSLLALQLRRFKPKKPGIKEEKQGIKEANDGLYLANMEIDDLADTKEVKLSIADSESDTQELLKYKSLKYLGLVLFGLLLLIHLAGSVLIFLYFSLVSSSRTILRDKGIQVATFSVFTTVSSFSNCGFIPTNENMLVFKTDSILLLLITSQILLGNTLFAPAFWSILWFLRRITKRQEFDHLLKNSREIGFDHLLPGHESVLLAVTVLGFIVIQFITFCCLEWNSKVLDGLSSYQKIVGGLFLSVNSRHAGESVVDLSLLSPALLVLYIFIMYLPTYTFFLPFDEKRRQERICKKEIKNKRGKWLKNLTLPQPPYLVIFIILICITEQRKLIDDPLNFNVLNIVFEVISAYGNVGFTTGYSCQRLLKVSPEAYCKNAWYGFSGRWSKQGKALLIVVMIFGRLKQFSMHGGKAWVIR